MNMWKLAQKIEDMKRKLSESKERIRQEALILDARARAHYVVNEIITKSIGR